MANNLRKPHRGHHVLCSLNQQTKGGMLTEGQRFFDAECAKNLALNNRPIILDAVKDRTKAVANSVANYFIPDAEGKKALVPKRREGESRYH